jgi:serine/threonine-protein kinase
MTQPRLLGDRYELEGVVGRGGMAEVYRARDIRLDRIVAIKTLRADLAQDQTFQARFRREAQSAASLNHPSIVAVYDTGEDKATGVPVPYIVMEYVDGRTVRDLLIEGHRLTPERTMEIIGGVLRALEYSHQAGIVHRDIKPGNVMVTRNGDVKVMDFGIARAMNDSQATMTQTAQVIGTAQYLSPEQARGERVDARSDLYSTGCLMYELLTGRPPFTGDSPVAIAYQHVRENPVPPTQLDPELPQWADAIVLKAMAKSPGDRYQSAAEMAADVQRAASGMQVAAMPPPATRMDYYGGGYPEQTQRMGATGPMMQEHTASIPPYQQGGYDGYDDYDRGYGGRRGGRRWVPWLIGALVVVAAVVVAVMMLSNGGKSYFVPQVDGLSQQTAVQQIKAAGFNPVVETTTSSSVPKGNVIDTNPANGSSAPKGSNVTVDVSGGPASVAVPQIQAGEAQQAAVNAVQKAGLVPVVKQDQTSTQPNGTIDHTDPPSGKEVAPNSTVNLFVSGGGVTVQSYIGDTVGDATQKLQNAGLTPKTVYQPSNSGAFVPPGTVWNQTPDSGVVPRGSTVTLYAQPQNTPSSSPSPTATGTSTSSPPPGGGGQPSTAPSTTPSPTVSPPGNSGGGNP